MKKILLALFTTIILVNFSFGQTNNDIINQDVKFTKILDEKRKINSSITVNDRYKIQIFHGNSEGATKTLNQFKKDFKDLDATIVFSTPNYKVWVGSFKTRIEAVKAQNELLKKYDRAIIIKPNK